MAQRTFAPDLIKSALCISVGDCEEQERGEGEGKEEEGRGMEARWKEGMKEGGEPFASPRGGDGNGWDSAVVMSFHQLTSKELQGPGR